MMMFYRFASLLTNPQLVVADEEEAGGIFTDASTAANMDRGFCPKKRSAAVALSGRVSRKLYTAVRHARFRGLASARPSWLCNER